MSVEARDLVEVRRFYRDGLGCTESRISADHVQFNLGDQRIDCHVNPQLGHLGRVRRHYQLVNGAYRLVPQCTLWLSWEDWKAVAARIMQLRLPKSDGHALSSLGARKENAVVTLLDPSGNLIEIKLAEGARASAARFARAVTSIACVSGIIAVIIGAWYWHGKASIVEKPTESVAMSARICTAKFTCE